MHGILLLHLLPGQQLVDNFHSPFTFLHDILPHDKLPNNVLKISSYYFHMNGNLATTGGVNVTVPKQFTTAWCVIPNIASQKRTPVMEQSMYKCYLLWFDQYVLKYHILLYKCVYGKNRNNEVNYYINAKMI